MKSRDRRPTFKVHVMSVIAFDFGDVGSGRNLMMRLALHRLVAGHTSGARLYPWLSHYRVK